MHKDFKLCGCVCPYAFYFFKAKLARQHDALYALFAKQVDCAQRRGVHLRRSVQPQPREKLLHHADNAEILYNKAVRPYRVKIGKKAVQPFRFTFLYNGVYRYEYFFPHAVQRLHRRLKLIPCEVCRAQPRVKAFESEIDRVGSFTDGGVKRFYVSCRCQ